MLLKSLFSFLMLGMFLCFLQAEGFAVCPPVAKLGAIADKEFYYASKEDRSWFQAKEMCECNRLEIATIDNQAQWDFLGANYMENAFSGWFWVGGRDSHVRRQFVWDDTKKQVTGTFPFKIVDNLDYQTCLLYSSKQNDFQLAMEPCKANHIVGVLCQVPMITQ